MTSRRRTARVIPLPVGRLRLDALRCSDCGGPGCWIICDSIPTTAFCSPDCAAASGVLPWAGADLVTRMAWTDAAGVPDAR